MHNQNIYLNIWKWKYNSLPFLYKQNVKNSLVQGNKFGNQDLQPQMQQMSQSKKNKLEMFRKKKQLKKKQMRVICKKILIFGSS